MPRDGIVSYLTMGDQWTNPVLVVGGAVYADISDRRRMATGLWCRGFEPGFEYESCVRAEINWTATPLYGAEVF